MLQAGYCSMIEDDIDDLVQDCSNSRALAMELLQSCTKPLLASEGMDVNDVPVSWYFKWWWWIKEGVTQGNGLPHLTASR